jgi:LacI family transcriptional regulator
MTRVSLAEVARRSGVSVATASRVLNPRNDHPVSAELRERVLRTAAEFDYSVNGLARGLKMLRTQTVAVVVHDIRDPYFSECTRGVADAADAAGYLTVVCNSDRDPDRELRYVQLAYEQRVAGILFAGSGFAGTRYRARLRRQVAGLEGYGAHAIALSPRRDRLPAEVPDNVGGARSATGHLLGLGHERIAFVDGPAGLETSRERLAGYRDALAAAGLELDESLVVQGDFSVTGGAQAVRALLASGQQPTAVLASNDAMAIGALGELGRRGLRVPRDVSLVGFDDIPAVRWLDPPLTTVAVPMAEIGSAGMQRLLSLLQENGARPRGERLVNVHPTELVVRGSTAPPQRKETL